MVFRRSPLRRESQYRFALLLAMMIVTPILGVISSVPPAGATPTKPPTDESYYVNTSSTTSAYNAGCTQGTNDASTGKNSIEFLDFGGQTSTGSFTAFGSVSLTYSQIENIGLAFAQGY